MFVMPRRRAAWNTLNVASMLLWNVATSLASPGAGMAPRCTRPSTPPALVDPVERVDDVAVVGEVDVDEVGTALAEPIDRDDLVPVRTEFADDGAPELAR